MAKENKNYKDSVFTDLFYSDRDANINLLSLYNALYGTAYTDPELIRKVRLEDVIFKSLKGTMVDSNYAGCLVPSVHWRPGV